MGSKVARALRLSKSQNSGESSLRIGDSDRRSRSRQTSIFHPDAPSGLIRLQSRHQRNRGACLRRKRFQLDCLFDRLKTRVFDFDLTFATNRAK